MMEFAVGQSVFFHSVEDFPGDMCIIKAIDEDTSMVWLRNASMSPMRVYISISTEELRKRITTAARIP